LIRSQQALAWDAIYAIVLCVFVPIASEFMSVSLLSPSYTAADG
jgi:hypothetical protein